MERLGFNRFWLAEHHNMDGIASSATALLIGHIAGGTSRIRVGSGGVMLPNHAPLVVAENFGTLETLYPGRIDLGLGRAPGADQATMRALRRDRLGNGDDFPEQVAELEMLLGPRRSQQSLLAVPGEGTQVPIWLLGSSLFSAHLAAQKGLPYAFASHFAPRYLHEALRIYRSNFQPLGGTRQTLRDDRRAADRRTYRRRGRVPRHYRLPARAGADPRREPETEAAGGKHGAVVAAPRADAVGSFFGLAVIGGPEKVRARLEILLEQTGADELIFTSDFYEHAHRLRSCEIVAG
ncbi:LLM class flavin-dependent oxidoreductase [Pseudomonas aeruginosa]|uniref:LLM class flavin-dependent oxidoreductase n=1 Tax=Pseudomonas aeruginosa TaxID=287 RepID=UPI003D2860BF